MRLPDPTSWSFTEIRKTDPARANRLEVPYAPAELVNDLADALRAGLQMPGLTFLARELRGRHGDDCRPVVQFAVSRDLFDRFFNSRAGYRAHFRSHYKCGLRFNNQIIAALHDVLKAGASDAIAGRLLGFPAEDLGPTSISKAWLLRWLEPYVSKIWWCRDRFRVPSGMDGLNLGIYGPRLLLAGSDPWVAPYRDETEAWLEVKGRFFKSQRYDQGKKLILTRAIGLRDRGTA